MMTAIRQTIPQLRSAPLALSVVGLLLILSATAAVAQRVDRDIEPWRLVRVFIEQTGSPSETIDREAFRERLVGRLDTVDVNQFRGMWDRYVDVKIDTMIVLPSRSVVVPPPPGSERPPRVDTIERLAVYATTYIRGNYDNSYFFLEHDSLWKIDRFFRFPSAEDRLELTARGRDVDTTKDGFVHEIRSILNLLVDDRQQVDRYQEIRTDLAQLVPQLSRSKRWRCIRLATFDADEIDPFAALDDSFEQSNRFLYQLNLHACDRIYRAGITSIWRFPAGILFELGRSGEKSVGYLYQEEARIELNPDHFFALKPISSNWWFYKKKIGVEDGSNRRSGTYSLPEDLEKTVELTEVELARDTALTKRDLLREKEPE